MLTKVSIIIRVKNEGKNLGRLLSEIKKQKSPQFDIEVVVIDSFSTDDTIKVALDNGYKVIELDEKDFTWGRGLNVGIENASGEYCVLVSAHCIPVNDRWLASLVTPLIKDNRVVATFGRLLPLHGLDPFEEVELEGWDFKKKFRVSRGGISFSNACIRKKVWEKFRIDERLSSYEDVEWYLRVRKAGFSVAFVPEAAVYHSHRLRVENVYIRWYSRARTALNIFKKYDGLTSKILGLCCKKPLTTLIPAIYALLFLNSYLFKDIINCVKKRDYFFAHLRKAPFYEIIRSYAIYKGLKDGLIDIKNNRFTEDFLYRTLRPPSFLKKFKSIIEEKS